MTGRRGRKKLLSAGIEKNMVPHNLKGPERLSGLCGI